MAIAICCTAAKIFTPQIRSRFGIIAGFLKDREKPRLCHNAWSIACNSYSKKNSYPEEDPDYEKTEPNPKKKKVYEARITLIMENDTMSITTLERAEKIATRGHLKLVKIMDFDTKTERPIYKLMSSKNYIREKMESKKQKMSKKSSLLKEEKTYLMSTKIATHDFQTKCRSILKLLKKRHEIRILLSIDNNVERAEELFNEINTMMGELSKIKKIVTASHYKIYLCPVIKEEAPEESEAQPEQEVEKPAANQ